MHLWGLRFVIKSYLRHTRPNWCLDLIIKLNKDDMWGGGGGSKPGGVTLSAECVRLPVCFPARSCQFLQQIRAVNLVADRLLRPFLAPLFSCQAKEPL